jgi:hypothetical protein
VLGLISGYTLQSDQRDLEEDNRTEKTNLHMGSVGIFTRYGFNPGKKLVFHLEPSAQIRLSKG